MTEFDLGGMLLVGAFAFDAVDFQEVVDMGHDFLASGVGLNVVRWAGMAGTHDGPCLVTRCWGQAPFCDGSLDTSRSDTVSPSSW